MIYATMCTFMLTPSALPHAVPKKKKNKNKITQHSHIKNDIPNNKKGVTFNTYARN